MNEAQRRAMAQQAATDMQMIPMYREMQLKHSMGEIDQLPTFEEFVKMQMQAREMK